jgi:hypothetical protein
MSMLMSMLKMTVIAASLLLLADWALTASVAPASHEHASYYGNIGYASYHR